MLIAFTPPNGTTSACAENTWTDDDCAMAPRNYLRMRGEYISGHFHNFHIEELPPHARRILISAWYLTRYRGTTSACAENTGELRHIIEWDRNYLRMRGEYPHSCYVHTGLGELPPHARRIPIINIALLCATWNYLRMRGEYSKISSKPTPTRELPPHARRILHRLVKAGL